MKYHVGKLTIFNEILMMVTKGYKNAYSLKEKWKNSLI